MSWEAIISISLSVIILVVTVWGVCVTKKSNKAVMRQNLEIEYNGIMRDLADIDAQIRKEEVIGNEMNRHVYGIHPNPLSQEIDALKRKQSILLRRKQEIEQQL